MSKSSFVDGLAENSIEKLSRIPKSDLHSHAGRGGKLSYIEKYAGVTIAPPTKPFASLDEMNGWFSDHIKCYLPAGIGNYLKRVEAAFAQAKADHVKVLALSYGIDEVLTLGGIAPFIARMNELHRTFAPETDFFPDLDIYGQDGTEYLDEIYDQNWFNAIDIINYGNSLSMKEMKCICRRAKSRGLVLKAHIGEFSSADEVIRYAEELELDEIQHGVTAASSPQIMKWLSENGVQLNVCPTSNIMLGVCNNYRTHPIRILYDYGVKVTINTDDLLIFNSTLSEEYLHLYRAGLMNADELYTICQNGLLHRYAKRA